MPPPIYPSLPQISCAFVHSFSPSFLRAHFVTYTVLSAKSGAKTRGFCHQSKSRSAVTYTNVHIQHNSEVQGWGNVAPLTWLIPLPHAWLKSPISLSLWDPIRVLQVPQAADAKMGFASERFVTAPMRETEVGAGRGWERLQTTVGL